MFEELRNAWRQAVDNFYRELRTEPTLGDGADRFAAMRRDHAAAADACRRVERERDRAREELRHEREEEAVCRRRESMAREIGDGETAEVAARYAVRHADRARVLEQVAVALSAEAELRRRDVEEMRAALAAFEASSSASGVGSGGAAAGLDQGPGAAAGPGAAPADATRTGAGAGGGPRPSGSLFDDDAEERLFRRMERERAAEARLEELKRKMR